jgi:hypothetical protein
VSPVSIVLVAFAVALVVMSFAFLGGAVIVALPLAAAIIAFVAFTDFNRRRKQAKNVQEFREDAKTKDVEFTDRDKETLLSE